jgi:hypothetical protein
LMGIGDWGLGIGDWGLGIGDWASANLFAAGGVRGSGGGGGACHNCRTDGVRDGGELGCGQVGQVHALRAHGGAARGACLVLDEEGRVDALGVVEALSRWHIGSCIRALVSAWRYTGASLHRYIDA